MEPFAGNVDRRAVREMAAAGEIHAQKFVPGLEQREEYRLVGGGAGMRLNISEFAIEQPLGPLDRQSFHLIDKFTAAVIAPPRITLGVFVGGHRTLRFEDSARDDVLRCDQFDLTLLAAQLGGDRGGDVSVAARKRRFKKAVALGGAPGGLAHWALTTGGISVRNIV